MPLMIVCGDIVQMETDCIVNSANPQLLGAAGGADGAIHRAAGPKLREACAVFGGCLTGQVKVTPGFDLKAKHVIHTVGPVWEDGTYDEDAMLTSCYVNALSAASELGAESIAFPLISTGRFGFPRERGLRVANAAIRGWLGANEMDVYLVVYKREDILPEPRIFDDVEKFLEENEGFVTRTEAYRPRMNEPLTQPVRKHSSVERSESVGVEEVLYALGAGGASSPIESDFDAEDNFRRKLFAYIDEKGLADVDAYKRSNISRKVFSKIKSQVDYRPSRETALAFAVGLRLSVDEAEELLAYAGYALSPGFRGDRIVAYCLENGIYDIYAVNSLLFRYEEKLLGMN